MKHSIMFGVMLLLVGCGDAQFTSKGQATQQSEIDPDLTVAQDVPSEDAGQDSAVTVTDSADAGSDSSDVDSAVAAIDAGQVVSPESWGACCNDCASTELLCLRGYGDGAVSYTH